MTSLLERVKALPGVESAAFGQHDAVELWKFFFHADRHRWLSAAT